MPAIDTRKIYLAVLITQDAGEDGRTEFKVDMMGWSPDEGKVSAFIAKQSRFLSKTQQIDVFDAEEIL